MAWEKARRSRRAELGWQREEIGSRSSPDEDYLGMVLQKTCWLAAIYPCASLPIGARGGYRLIR